MLARRLQRWSVTKPTLGEHIAFNGYMYAAAQSQKAVSAYVTGEQILPFGFAERYDKWQNHHIWLQSDTIRKVHTKYTRTLCSLRSRLAREKSYISSKHEALPQRCFDVGPTSKTAGQQQNNFGEMPRVCWGLRSSTIWSQFSKKNDMEKLCLNLWPG